MNLLNHSFNISLNVGLISPFSNKLVLALLKPIFIFSSGFKSGIILLSIKSNSYNELLLLLPSISFSNNCLFFIFFISLTLFKYSSDKENLAVSGRISYKFDKIIFKSFKVVFPKRILFSKLSSFLGFLFFNFIGK